MYQLKGRIQTYAWGGNNFIPDLFHLESDRALPSAEYWLGTHPGGITEVVMPTGENIPLAKLIDSNKEKYLGAKVQNRFGELPFLFKVLDVKDMLSIQVHPTKSAAEKGFDEENLRGIPLDASNRNYKDRNHKPEVMIALSEFWLLHGFADDISERLLKYSFLRDFESTFKTGGIKALYKVLMELNQKDVDILLGPLAKEIIPLYRDGKLQKSSPHFWAARAFENLCADGHYDKGIFSIYLFNILRLEPGDGIFQGAGMPHAYLEGQNVELMANSDNVLRAGLTPKHIDIDELLKNTLFNPTSPKIIKAKRDSIEQQYDCPIPDFSIISYNLAKEKGQQLCFPSPSIVLFVKGNAYLNNDPLQSLYAGSAFFLPPGEAVEIKASSDLYFIVASVP